MESIKYNLRSLPLVIFYIVLSYLCFYFVRALYYVYFHPLSRFPGPKLAAATLWYEFYYDCYLRGQYTWKIKKLHDQYGKFPPVKPIPQGLICLQGSVVRISPHELHVNDPQFIDQIYTSGAKKRDKYGYYTIQFGNDDSAFGTVAHDHHRLRRGAVSKFFSKGAVNKLEPFIRDSARKMCDKILLYAGSPNPLILNDATSCFTSDVVTGYCFGESYGFLDNPNFQPNLHDAVYGGSAMGRYVKQLPWLLKLILSLPDSVALKLNPAAAQFLAYQKRVKAQLAEIKVEVDERREKSEAVDSTVFHTIFTGDLPDQEKTVHRCAQEANAIVGAGTETTAFSIAVNSFYLLHHPQILEKLRTEIIAAPNGEDGIPSLTTLEQLPYLSAVISEGLRLTYGVVTRLARVSPDSPLILKSTGPSSTLSSGFSSVEVSDVVIPAGTPVGMTSYLIHHDESIFPDSFSFKPERWIDPASGQRRIDLERYLLSFSKGSRQCLGINLAYAEIYIALAMLAINVLPRCQLYETGVDDVKAHYDYFVPGMREDSKGVRILVW